MKGFVAGRVIIITALVLVFFILAGGVAPAGRYDGSTSSYLQRKVDTSITPQRVQILESRLDRNDAMAEAARNRLGDFTRRTVFWVGQVTSFQTHPQNYWLRVKAPGGELFWVSAKKNVRNLDFDRTGYRVGVKGTIVLGPDHRMEYLDAGSVVILAPPEELSYRKFSQKYRLVENFTLDTPHGPKHLSNPAYPFILHRIYIHNPHYPWEKVQKIAGSIIYYSDRYQVAPLLVTALVNIESAFDVDAVSSAGAIGLGQLMPSTAAGMGLDPHDLTHNIEGCVRYLSRQIQRFGRYPDRVTLALAAYNAGPGAVTRHGGVPPYSETKNYIYFINLVLEEYQKQLEE